MKREVTTTTKETQGIISDSSENQYSNKLESLEKIDKFLGTYDHPKLKQDDFNHISRSIQVMKLKE
jgi:hypothetical protein